jgi:hypothetical protein
MAAAVLLVLYLDCVVSDKECDLPGKRPGAGKVGKKIPDARSLMPVLLHGVLEYSARNISIDRETFLIPQSQDMSQGQVCTCDTPQAKTLAICSLLSLKIARGHLLAAGNALIGLGRIWCVQKKPA